MGSFGTGSTLLLFDSDPPGPYNKKKGAGTFLYNKEACAGAKEEFELVVAKESEVVKALVSSAAVNSFPRSTGSGKSYRVEFFSRYSFCFLGSFASSSLFCLQ